MFKPEVTGFGQRTFHFGGRNHGKRSFSNDGDN